MIYLVKKILAFISFLSIFLASSISTASAQITLCPKPSPFEKLCDLSLANSGKLVNNIVVLLLIVAIIIAVIFLIVGGIKWIVSGGDKSAVEGARNTIVAAIIGLIVALLAFVIIKIVLGLVGVEEPGGGFQIPPIIKP